MGEVHFGPRKPASASATRTWGQLPLIIFFRRSTHQGDTGDWTPAGLVQSTASVQTRDCCGPTWNGSAGPQAAAGRASYHNTCLKFGTIATCYCPAAYASRPLLQDAALICGSYRYGSRCSQCLDAASAAWVLGRRKVSAGPLQTNVAQV